MTQHNIYEQYWIGRERDLMTAVRGAAVTDRANLPTLVRGALAAAKRLRRLAHGVAARAAEKAARPRSVFPGGERVSP